MKKYMNCVTAAILGATAVVSQGDVNYTWTGDADGNWSNAANWAGGTLPLTKDGLIYGDHEFGNASIITIQNGTNMPASNIPMYANDWWRTPHFVVESGASFSVAQGDADFDGPTGVGAIATVGSGATLTMTGSPTMVLMRDGDGRQSYNVTGGTLNIFADEFSFGYNNLRFSDWNLDAGNVVLTHKTWGLDAKVNTYGNGERWGPAVGTGFDDVNQSKVTLKNGSSFLINGKFAGRMDDSGDGSATVVFDIQNGSSLTFLLDTNSVFGTLADVEAGEGKYWTSSTQGDTTLRYAIDGEKVTISALSQQAYAEWVTQYPTLGASTNYTDDFEPDGMDNLLEYALGGNPTNSDAAAILPTSEMDGDWLNYVYNRRDDATARNLTYTVFDGTDLVFGPFTTNVEVGVSGAQNGFETVTNRVPVDAEAQRFMQLKVEIAN